MGVLVEVVTVMVLVKVGLALGGLKTTEIPLAVRSEADSVMGWVLPLSRVTVTVAVVLPP